MRTLEENELRGNGLDQLARTPVSLQDCYEEMRHDVISGGSRSDMCLEEGVGVATMDLE